jgi:iron complex transport system substrate-binding protein
MRALQMSEPRWRPGLAAVLAGWAAVAQAAPPQRIVTLSPSLAEAVCALGRCAALVATDRHADWPASVAALPKVGGLEDAQIEAIARLQPDLVLLGPRSRAGERLQALGFNAKMVDARTHADLRRALLRLGDLLEDRPRAEALLRDIDARIDDAARRLGPAWRGRSVYVEVGGGPVAASAGSFIGETLARLGLRNVVGDDAGLFPRVNPEQIVRSAPDLVVGPASSLADLAQRPGWHTLPALRHGRICRLDARQHDLLSRPGPRLGEAAQMLADCLLALPSPPRSE